MAAGPAWPATPLRYQVNALFGDWLENLRKQGEIEVLDPALEPAVRATGAGAGGE